MTNSNHRHVETAGPGIETVLFGKIGTDAEAQIRVSETNRSLEEAGRRFWGDGPAGRMVAVRLLEQFGATAAALEAWGWSAERIQADLGPSRQVFATSSFMRRCQQWPRGYAGDFETIEYLAGAINNSVPGTLGWHLEETLLQSPVVRQHRNKLNHQSREIAHAVMTSSSARVLSMACGGCLDWVPVLPYLKDFAGEIVLNDSDPSALELAEQRLRPATIRYRLAPGNVLRVAKRLARGPRFDLVIAGGLFDYLTDQAIVFLLRTVFQDLLAPGGVLLFTNIAKGNPWRALMEHGSNWTLIERTEGQIRELCREAGMASTSVSLKRESTGLTLLTRVVQPSSRLPLPPRSDCASNVRTLAYGAGNDWLSSLDHSILRGSSGLRDQSEKAVTP